MLVCEPSPLPFAMNPHEKIAAGPPFCPYFGGIPMRADVHRSRSRGQPSLPECGSAESRSPHNEQESDKAISMSGFKEPSFADRQKAAQQARQDILNKFKSQPGPDDPAVKQRQAEREAQAAARPQAKGSREAAQAEQKAREPAADARAGAPLP